VNVEVRDRTNKKIGELELDDAVFAVKKRTHVVYETVKAHLAGLRAGTHSTKTRAMVSGGGRKPWRQKGTGRARHGSIRSPIWRAGGVAHGPHPRSYDLKVNRKAHKAAMRVALSEKLRESAIMIVDELGIAEAKTKHVATLLAGLGIEGRALIVDAGNDALQLAARNHPRVDVITPSALSVYDILRNDQLVMTRAGAERVQEIFGS